MARLLKMQDEYIAEDIIKNRKRLGLELYDEVWEGMYVMPSMPSLEHQELVLHLSTICAAVLGSPQNGRVFPGANVSDRNDDWKENYRIPDVVVVLKNSHAELCDTYIYLGPDFIVEIESPGDDTEEKIPFYAEIGVRELLILHRDRRTLRLLRHDGNELVEVQPTTLEGKAWLVSEVLPLAFRRRTIKGAARNEVRHTNTGDGTWVI